jgi:N-acetylmuramic acid 6-phosphate etherase
MSESSSPERSELASSERSPSPSPARRDHLPTEQPNSASADLDQLALDAAFDVINDQDAEVAAAVARAKTEIVRAIELVAERLARGGRYFACGAGTSGRLCVLDATECPPTFHTDPERVQGVLAGGADALTRAVEGAEDSRAAGRSALLDRGLAARDVVLAVSAGGTTPFAHGALDAARERGAASIFLACVDREHAPDRADVSIRVITGPEVIAGSTRMKAGTATKLVLNTISTLAMVRLGRVHSNLMVDVNTHGNAKLWQRGIDLVARLSACDRPRAEEFLQRADGRVKVAVIMARRGVDAAGARARLDDAGGFLRRALDA